ncbi:ATP-grasp domain-containing protein [Streptomyces sp. NPDC058001]|uniref:ATP-grasp domain-containing protein n=1 Tax=Streptomyces sp. NPDC058001 TaxID=3346300 RepID=UPI0036E9A2F8
MPPGFLFCADPLRGSRPDAHFADEVAAVRAADAPRALIDHDALLAGAAREAVARVPRGSGAYWYRGWMMPVGRYEELERALRDRDCTLLTPAEQYGRAHELPGWYEVFEALTPRSVWRAAEPGAAPSPAELAALVAPLGPGAAIVKDYVKSRKHEWDEACYVPDRADTARLASVVDRFFALQEDTLAGGLVVRDFEPFVGRGEVRVWWVDGEAALVTPHPDAPRPGTDQDPMNGLPTPDLSPIRAAVRALGCRFVTTDLALRDDGPGGDDSGASGGSGADSGAGDHGTWRVVEVGDGQVSGLPRQGTALPTDELIAALASAQVSVGTRPPSR